MRIAKVALTFFSIGFVAGSFERAAGLGRIDQPRASRDGDVAARVLIIRSTTAPLVMLASFRAGLPEELLARPIVPRNGVPDATAEALAELADAEAGRTSPVLFAPLELEDRALLALQSPNAHRPRLGAKRKMSGADRVPLSERPPPISPAVAEPFWVPVPGQPERNNPSAALAEFIMPFERGRVTSLFNQGRYHPAIDLAGALGSPVHATTRRQRVTFAGWRNGYGNAVVTRDDFGRTHLYGHLQRIFARVGTVLDQGQRLGALGSTGHSTGPHVHYELRAKSGAHLDPVSYLFGRRVGRGYAWNGSRSVTRFAARGDRQPRPR